MQFIFQNIKKHSRDGSACLYITDGNNVENGATKVYFKTKFDQKQTITAEALANFPSTLSSHSLPLGVSTSQTNISIAKKLLAISKLSSHTVLRKVAAQTRKIKMLLDLFFCFYQENKCYKNVV